MPSQLALLAPLGVGILKSQRPNSGLFGLFCRAKTTTHAAVAATHIAAAMKSLLVFFIRLSPRGCAPTERQAAFFCGRDHTMEIHFGFQFWDGNQWEPAPLETGINVNAYILGHPRRLVI